MELDLPLYAVQRLADGTWLIRTPMGDPLWPAVDVVAVVGAQASAAPLALLCAVRLARLRDAGLGPGFKLMGGLR